MSSPKEQQFEQLVKENRDRIFRICRAYLKDPDDAKDLYLDILLRIWTNLDHFRGDAQLSTWLYRIAVNTALLYQRQQQRQPGRLPDHELHLPDSALETAEKRQQELRLTQLQNCIQQLEKQDRLIISLVLEEVSYKEIAEVLGLSVSHVGVKINRIKQKLTVLMEQATRSISTDQILGTMNFEELQKTWQAQQAPEHQKAVLASNTTHVLDQVKKLQRKVIFSNLGVSVSLGFTCIFLGFMWAHQENVTLWFHLGMALIFLDMLLTAPLMWLRSVPWGNLRPDLSSREYIQAALKSFRFRNNCQKVLIPVYSIVLFLGLHLVYLGIFHDRTLGQRLIIHGAGTAFMLLLVVVTRYYQLNRYTSTYEPVVKELEKLEKELSDN